MNQSTTRTVDGVRYLTSKRAVTDFFELASAHGLPYPAVVVTRASTAPEPFVPLADLLDAVGDLADVYFLDAPVDARDVLRELKADRHALDIYGGATRVYPAGMGDTSGPFISRDPDDGARTVQKVARYLRNAKQNRGSTSYTTTTGDAADTVHRESDTIRAIALHADNTALQAEVTRLTNELDSLRAKTPKARVGRPIAPAARTDRRMFMDASDEVRFRVMALWAEQTTPQEKIDAPLPRYTFGDEFSASLETLAATSPVLFDKVARCILRVLLGQDRDGHKLDLSGRTREDGAVAWRSYVEQSTASARRLHFWRLPGGGIELSRVVLHDDYTP